mgnify:CR=1 FL=1
MPVPSSVLAAWGLDVPAEPLEGGQGTSVRAGDVVLKPYADEAHVAWYAGLCARTAPSDAFLLPAVVPARDGRLVVDGWTAAAFTDGEPVHDDDTAAASWLPVLAAGRAFHAAVASEPPPALLASRTDRWAQADRVAWGELAATDVGARSRPLLDAALALVVDEGLSSQLIHGDLSGNVLLGRGLVPTVIDVSPYWRPAAYADAVVAVDAFLWWRADPEILPLAHPSGLGATSWRSLLARAFVFRLLAFDEPRRDPDDVATELPRYADLLSLVAA